jgi:hypothetical protein
MIWVSLSWTFEGLAEPGLLHLNLLVDPRFRGPRCNRWHFQPKIRTR